MNPFPTTPIANIRTQPPADQWLVRDLWAWPAVGFIAGTPKSCKTWLALELAVAVASGRPCLGGHQVDKPGPVLLYAAEDSAEAIRERVEGIAKAREITLGRLAVSLITETGLRLDLDTHRQRLLATIEHMRPRLLVLDPLVRLHRADENSSAEISELLGFLRELQRQFGVAIALVHHVRKSSAAQPGQALRGSGDLHAWSDSSLYILQKNNGLQLHVEHRGNPTPHPINIELADDPVHLIAHAHEDDVNHPQRGLDRRIVDLLSQMPLSRTNLRDMLKIRNETLGYALKRLEAEGRIIQRAGGWTVPVPPHRDQPERNDPKPALDHESGHSRQRSAFPNPSRRDYVSPNGDDR